MVGKMSSKIAIFAFNLAVASVTLLLVFLAFLGAYQTYLWLQGKA